MPSAKSMLYGLASSVVLFTVVIAIQQIYLHPVDADTAASRSERGAKARLPHGRGPGSSVFTEPEADLDTTSDDGTVAPGKSRAKPDSSRSAGPSVSAQPAAQNLASVARNRASATDDGWLNAISTALAGALTGGGAAPAAPGPTAAPATLSDMPSADDVQVQDVLYSDRPDTACLPGNREFTLEDVRGLYVCVVWSGITGTYAQQVTFESPDGHVYQTITSAFATAQGPATGGTVQFGGRQYPVQAAGWGADGRVLVTAALPVAGTFITQYNLAGLWTVKVSLNGQPVVQDTFELTSRN